MIPMLLESREIKYLQPEVNKAQRTKAYPYFIHTYRDELGYICFAWEKSSIKRRKDKKILNHYGSKMAAKSHLAGLVSELGLCLSKCGLYEREGPCYNFSIHKCSGACVEEETVEEYNERAEMGRILLDRMFDKDFIIQLDGRDHKEKAVALIEDGNYRGYGFISDEDFGLGIEDIKEAIKYEPPNPEANRIIYTYLIKHPKTKVIYY